MDPFEIDEDEKYNQPKDEFGWRKREVRRRRRLRRIIEKAVEKDKIKEK